MCHEAFEALLREAPQYGRQAAAICKTADTCVYFGQKTAWLSSGEAFFTAILKDLEEAKHSIFLEFYHIHPGVLWNSVVKILYKKAAAGVDVRLVYDRFGCLFSKSYRKKLASMHIGCTAFPENRNHRRRLVIDDRIAYVGAIDLADEALGLNGKYGQWKDGAIRMEKGSLSEPYGYLVPFLDAPGRQMGRDALYALFSGAKRSIAIMTPCFLPDDILFHCLYHAARSGVQVTVVVPARSADRRSHTLLSQLVSRGAAVVTYPSGMLHTRVYCADEEAAVVGTFKLDHQSLYRQYGNGVWLYGHGAVRDIVCDIRETIAVCHPMEI